MMKLLSLTTFFISVFSFHQALAAPVACMEFREGRNDPRIGNNRHLRSFSVGDQCETSKGGTFELVARTRSGSEVWQDRDTGIVWGDLYEKDTQQWTAAWQCGWDATRDSRGNLGGSWELPTKQDYELAERHGLRETFRKFSPYFYYWTRTVHRNWTFAYVYSYNGGIYYMRRLNPFYELYTRCIRR